MKLKIILQKTETGSIVESATEKSGYIKQSLWHTTWQVI